MARLSEVPTLALEKASGPEFSAQLPEARSHTALPAK